VKRSHPSTAATTRIVGSGSRHVAHSSTVAGFPSERLRNTADFTSRQPLWVLTLPASIGSSTSPRAAAKRAASARIGRSAAARRAVA